MTHPQKRALSPEEQAVLKELDSEFKGDIEPMALTTSTPVIPTYEEWKAMEVAVKSKKHKKVVFGLCSKIANKFELDSWQLSMLRIFSALLIFGVGGFFPVLYVIAAYVVPAE